MVKFELSNLRGIKQIIFKIQDHIQHSAPNPPSSLGNPLHLQKHLLELDERLTALLPKLLIPHVAVDSLKQ